MREKYDDERNNNEDCGDSSICNSQYICDKSANNQIGKIVTSFPVTLNPEFEGRSTFPKSYYTLTGKECLLLLFTENFRRQFNDIYSKRKPLILAIPNECGVQKFVSTTIRPTAFLYPEMIGEWEEISKFVADFITYEPLENPLVMPNRLISPETLIKRRKGNSFEIATLLCSLLIGTGGYAAMVVSGYANREVSTNDQRRTNFPYPMDITETKTENIEKKENNKYALREPPDLSSKFLLEVEQRKEEKLVKEHNRKAAKLQAEIDALEKLDDDPFEGRRLHAWIVIVQHAQWSYKPDKKSSLVFDDDTLGSSKKCLNEQKSFFIEPSTGFRFEANNLNYLGIESVWNQHNYYINRQEPINDIANMQWNFQNTNHWEHLLPGEPYELRIERPLPDECESLSREQELLKEKHLDMPITWVQQLNITQNEYEERYPNGEKIIHYKRGIYERFAPYRNVDGLMKRYTTYETIDYQHPLMRWEWYENRQDLLKLIKIDFLTKQIEEYFVKGRTDCLKSYAHNSEPMTGKIFQFYYTSRLDSLKTLESQPKYIREYFDNRNDFLYFREFEFKEKTEFSSLLNMKMLIRINEKFYRNQSKVADNDISSRTFELLQSKIFLQFHYDSDAITASTKCFQKPPAPDYGCEIIFDPQCIVEYNANPTKKNMTQVEQYLLLLEQLKSEENSKSAFRERCKDIVQLLDVRKHEMVIPKLTFSIFDPCRNSAARTRRMAKYEEIKKREKLIAISEPDYLAPYLIIIGADKKKANLEDSQLAITACLNDIKHTYLEMLNGLQKTYDELCLEENNFKTFLNKFHSQFNDHDYEQLIKDGENIELHKRTLQQRLINTKEESENKYQKVKELLLNDSRLTILSSTIE